MSETAETQNERVQPDAATEQAEAGAATAQPVIGKSFLIVMAAIMSVPALVPILVLVEPSLVPFVHAVNTANGHMTIFMVITSIVLLLANWGFLYLIYRWLNNYAGQQ